MNLYYDSEFTGLNQQAQLISLALIDESGRCFYAEFTDFDRARCDSWIHENVIAHSRWIASEVAPFVPREQNRQTLCYNTGGVVAAALRSWLAAYGQVRIWADCLAYDWVLFCELFGGALRLPANVFYMPLDLVTLLYSKGLDADISRAAFAGLEASSGYDWQAPHNALYDAQVLKACVEKARKI